MEYSFWDCDGYAPSKIADALAKICDYYVPIFICIGTDAAIGDSLGPIVGTRLKESHAPAYVYGALSGTVTAKEIPCIKNFISTVHPLAKTIAIDAAVGNTADVGRIKLNNRGIYPGLGAEKELPLLGDYSIIGIVSCKSAANNDFMNLTRLSPVYKMADTIFKGIMLYLDICAKKPAYKSINGIFSKI